MKIIVAQTEYPPCARHCIKHFTCIMSVSFFSQERDILTAEAVNALPRELLPTPGDL